MKVTERISIEVKDQSYKGKITRRFDGDPHSIFSEIDIISLNINKKTETFIFKKVTQNRSSFLCIRGKPVFQRLRMWKKAIPLPDKDFGKRKSAVIFEILI